MEEKKRERERRSGGQDDMKGEEKKIVEKDKQLTSKRLTMYYVSSSLEFVSRNIFEQCLPRNWKT